MVFRDQNNFKPGTLNRSDTTFKIFKLHLANPDIFWKKRVHNHLLISIVNNSESAKSQIHSPVSVLHAFNHQDYILASHKTWNSFNLNVQVAELASWVMND